MSEEIKKNLTLPNSTKYKFVQIKTTGKIPKSRFSHISALILNNSHILIYGGADFNDCYLFDLCIFYLVIK